MGDGNASVDMVVQKLQMLEVETLLATAVQY